MSVWIRAALFIAIVPGAVAGWLPWYVAGAPAEPWRAGQGAWRIGGFLILAGWLVLLWCARDFALRGRGTPAPYDAPRELVIAGLYRYVRNPMYVGVLSAIVGQALWFRSTSIAWYAAAFALGFHIAVIGYEEPTLRRTFGDAYVDYCRRVPRWMPRWRHLP
jgi:protein-S-isoprenylcysteine O-methyltransferase Ste14